MCIANYRFGCVAAKLKVDDVARWNASFGVHDVFASAIEVAVVILDKVAMDARVRADNVLPMIVAHRRLVSLVIPH